jgi:hypothetical protein
MAMKAPSKEDRVTVELSTKPLNVDVDLSRGFTKSGDMSIQGNDEALAYGSINFSRITPEARAAAGLSTGYMPDEDDLDPAGYSPEMFDEDMFEMLNKTYTPQALKAIKDNFDAETVKKFYYQKAYDAVEENPNLKNYFTEYYPEKIQDLGDKTKEYGVTVGQTLQGEPIKAGEGYYSPFNVSGLFTEEATPFNSMVNERIAKGANVQDVGNRVLYEFGTGLVGLTDFINSPQERTIEFLTHWGYLVGATPQGIARLHNDFFKATDALTIGGDSGVAQFTDEEIEGMTWGKLGASEGTVTVGEKVQDFVARSFPIDAPENSLNFPLLKAAPEGQTPDQQLAGPGNYPIGQGPTAIIENYVGAALAVAGGRGVLEIGKAVGRRTGKFFDPKTGKYDERAHQIAINKQRDSSASMLGRAFAGWRQGGLDSSRNLVFTVANEQMLAAGAVAATHELGDLGLFKDNPQAQGITAMGVSLLTPIIMMGMGKMAGSLLYDNLAPFGEAYFSGKYATVAELLNTKGLNTAYGRRTVEEMGRSVATVSQQLPDDYDVLMLNFRDLKENSTRISTKLVEGGTSQKEADEMVGIMGEAYSNSWALNHFVGAQQTVGSMTYVQRKAFNVRARGSLNSNVDELKSMAMDQRIGQQLEKAIQTQGIILTRLTNKFTEFDEKGYGVTDDVRTLAIKMRSAYAANLGLEERKANKFINALGTLYNIGERYNAGDQDTAIADARQLFESFAPEDRGLFSDLVNKRIANDENYGGFGAKLEEFESIQKLIERDRGLVDQMYAPLRENGILNKLNVLDVKKPATGTMRKTQTSLMDTVFKANKDTSDNNYAAVFKDSDGPTVNMREFGAMLVQQADDQGFTYGADGLRVAMQELSNLSRLSAPFGDLGRMLKLGDEVEVGLESVADILNNLEDLSLKEAVALRGEIGQKAFLLSQKNNSTSRKGSAVLMQIHESMSTLVNQAAPPDSVIGASLREAQGYYRDNVAGLFYDPYIRKALNQNADMPIPFVHSFSRSTLRKVDEDGGQDTPMEHVEGLAERRQTHFDKMFPEGSKLRPQAVQEMRSVMLSRIFGENDPQKVTRVEFVDRLRQLVSSGANPLFNTKENGGYLDFILGDSTQDFVSIINVAPVVGKNEVMSGNPQANLQAEAGVILGPDSAYDVLSMDGNREAIGEMVGEVAKQASDRREIEQSPTLGIFFEISQSQDNLASIGEVLVNRILQESGPKAAEMYTSMVSDVRRVMPEQVSDFEVALNKVLFDGILKETSRAELDLANPNRELKDFKSLDDAMRENRELIATVAGEDSYGVMASFVKMGTLADNVAKTVYGSDINAMSESAALSRMWGVARGVVSLRYVGSEWLLRKFASNKNQALVEIMAVPGLAEHIMSGVEAGNYRPFFKTTMSQNLIPQLAAILADGEIASEDYQESLRALSNLYQSSKENNLDFLDNVVSLILATRNEDQVAELNEINDIITQFTDPTTESRSSVQKQMDALQPRPEVPESIMGLMRGNPKEGRLAPFGRP